MPASWGAVPIFVCPVRGRGGGSRTGVSLFFRNALSKWLGLPERLYALTERIPEKKQYSEEKAPHLLGARARLFGGIARRKHGTGLPSC